MCDITILNSVNKRVILKAEIAESDAEKSKGLMFRKMLPGDAGMLFRFYTDAPLNFWMKNTYISLSIAYIDSSGIIREIYDMTPLDTSVEYPSRYPARYALEVNRGWFARHNIARGSRIILNGCLGQ